ncbi:response regulator [Paenibacillus solisilvae]|uniref:Response regulator n=1 Tax=Paenibacillus solisilvae TaxID=2486751 RepID=A0ABW0VTK3_9BACL
MRKVLIVDDEEWARISIREQIDWASLGLTIAGEARNGRAALDLIRSDPPDILITDIRMPVMDGMALLELVHREYPEIISIVLSGYSEFEYAKKAIVYGVIDYILKPIDEDQLDQTLRRAAIRLNDEDSRTDKLIRMNIQLNESGPLTKERALTRLVTDPIVGIAMLRQALRKAGYPDERMKDSRRVVLVFESDNFEKVAANKYGNDVGLASFVLLNVLEELTQPLADGVLFRKYGQQNEFIWLKDFPFAEDETGKERPFDDFYGSLERAVARLEELTGFRLHVGVGGEFDSLLDAAHSYTEASEAVRNAGVVHHGTIVHADEVKGRNEYYVYPDNNEKALLHYMENGYGQQAVGMIDELFRVWKESETIRPDSMRGTLDEMRVGIRKLLRKHGIAETVLAELGLAEKDGSEYRSFEDMRRWLERAVDGAVAFLASGRKVGAKKAVEEIVQYLSLHYGEEISLHAVSERFHLNPAYLSRLFKTETGETFNDRLSRIRLEAAVRLLKNEQLKVVDIAPLVGYENPNYFLKKFKDFYGCTPSEYRKNHTHLN